MNKIENHVEDAMHILKQYTREEITGYQNYCQVSGVGLVQFHHNYDINLLNRILEKAITYKKMHSKTNQRGLNYIRAAHKVIPEIKELMNSSDRLDRIETLAGTRLEPYPVSIISSIISFTGIDPEDSSQNETIVWHCDGIPVTELIPLCVIGPAGGELQVYHGIGDEGLAQLEAGKKIPEEKIINVTHTLGYSTLAQLMRIMHRVKPSYLGYRVTLNLNLRSVEKPYIDDHNLSYLAVDNPDYIEKGYMQEYINDVRERHIPAFRNHFEY